MMWRHFMKTKEISKDTADFPLGVFLLSSPAKQDQDNTVMRNVEAYGLTQILQDDKFTTRHTASAGTNYREAVIDILESAGVTKYNIEQTDKTLPNDQEWAPGTEKIKAVNDLLSAINYTPIHDDSHGYFTSRPYRRPSQRSASYEYKTDELSVTFDGMTEELDLFNIPNQWVVVLSDSEREPLVATYTNDNPNSPTSTVNRDRTITEYREVDHIADQDSLDDYVERIAFESSQIYGKVEFETAIMPMHEYNDVLRLEFDTLDVNDKFTETEWTIPLENGGAMKHKARRVVQI